MNESDVYIDTDEAVNCFLYEPEPIPDSLLPPVFYAKKGDKRLKLDSQMNNQSPKKQNIPPSSTSHYPLSIQQNSSMQQQQSSSSALSSGVKAAVMKMENIIMTRPLFDKPNTGLIKLRRDIKMQKLKGWPNYKLDVIKSTLPIQPELGFGKDHHDWLPNDDFVILHVCNPLFFFI
jgi:hypothetical protein